jgi:hypothetical protein
MRLNLTPSRDAESVLREELAKLDSKEAAKQVRKLPAEKPVVTQPVFSENVERDGYEIRFPGPISRELSKEFSKSGWRFTRSLNDSRWYARRSAKAYQFASGIVNRLGGVNKVNGIITAVEPGQTAGVIYLPATPMLMKIKQAMEVAA